MITVRKKALVLGAAAAIVALVVGASLWALLRSRPDTSVLEASGQIRGDEITLSSKLAGVAAIDITLDGLGQYLAETAMAGTISYLVHILAIALAIWGFVELGCLRGTRGANRFGPDPLG